MKLNWSDKFREEYDIYLEPVLATACSHVGKKLGLTRSEYLRRAAIISLRMDKYPLDKVSNKFNDLYQGMTPFQ